MADTETTIQPIPAHGGSSADQPGDDTGLPSITTSGVLLDNDGKTDEVKYLEARHPGLAAITAVGVAVLDALDQVRPVEPGNDGPLYVQVVQDEDGTVIVRVMDENTDGFSRSFPFVLMERRVQLPAT